MRAQQGPLWGRDLESAPRAGDKRLKFARPHRGEEAA
jgi:hypothetical protein